jgi:hypothetical protein
MHGKAICRSFLRCFQEQDGLMWSSNAMFKFEILDTTTKRPNRENRSTVKPINRKTGLPLYPINRQTD